MRTLSKPMLNCSINRREVVLGGLLTIFFMNNTCSCNAQTKKYQRGCAITGQVAQNLLTSNFNNGSNSISIIKNSGNREFDMQAAQSLSFMTDLFRVLPGFSYFKEDSFNAYASNSDILGRRDGSILFGSDLLFHIFKESDAPDVVFSGICAHEYGHIVQFNQNIKLDQNHPTVKRSELHADFLAGYYAGRRKLVQSNFPAAAIAEAHENFGDYQKDAQSHHGTPLERSSAIVAGFKAGYIDKVSTSEALNVSLNYIKMEVK